MMFRAIHVAPTNAPAHEVWVSGRPEIADLVRNNRIDSFTCPGQALSFWFSPSLPGGQRLNTFATDLLAVAAPVKYGASRLPLLYGDIVVTAHDATGALTDLTDADMARLQSRLGWHREWVLAWRYTFAQRRINTAAAARVARR